MKRLDLKKTLVLLLVLLVYSGCPGPVASNGTVSSGGSSSTSSSSSTVTTLPGGPMAVKIIFKQNFPTGSFDAPSASGTVATPGGGLQAMRVFNPDGTLLASGGPGSSSWPAWLTSFELGVSGSNNSSASNAACARFSDTTEATVSNCDFGSGSVPCGAPTGLFRISEYDCTSAPGTTSGTGGGTDGVYFRVYLNRTNLGSSENIMAVLEYTASGLTGGAANPTNCFSGSTLLPENPGCADMVWRIFLKHSASEVIQPTNLMIPPIFSVGGSNVAARQFVLPINYDKNFSVIQFSRINALSSATPGFSTRCNVGNAGGVGDSPLCVGAVFYSLTLYRI